MDLSTVVGSGSLQGLYERYWENYERSLEGDPWPAQGGGQGQGQGQGGHTAAFSFSGWTEVLERLLEALLVRVIQF